MVKQLSILSILLCNLSFAQDSTFIKKEEHLAHLLTDLRKATNDLEKEEKNTLFKNELISFLETDNAYDYSFSRLKTMGVITSPDNTFKIYTWNVERDDFTHKYECLILRYDDRRKRFNLIEFADESEVLPERPEGVISSNSWYGALYYQIIPFQKGAKDMYIVLGWDGFTSMSNRKIIDVLYFSGNTAKLGSPIFKMGDDTKRRLFYEHAENATMSLRYDEQYNRILMDHLSPESPNLKGFHQYYVPDMSYDALVEEKGKWYLKEDVIAITHLPEKHTIKVIDQKTGKLVDKTVKNKWEDPSEGSLPGGGNEHVAQMPEEGNEEKNKKGKKGKNASNTAAPKGKTPSSYNPSSNLKKNKNRRWRKRN